MTEIDDACIVVTTCVGVLAMSQQRKPAHYFHQEEKSSSTLGPSNVWISERDANAKKDHLLHALQLFFKSVVMPRCVALCFKVIRIVVQTLRCSLLENLKKKILPTFGRTCHRNISWLVMIHRKSHTLLVVTTDLGTKAAFIASCCYAFPSLVEVTRYSTYSALLFP